MLIQNLYIEGNQRDSYRCLHSRFLSIFIYISLTFMFLVNPVYTNCTITIS